MADSISREQLRKYWIERSRITDYSIYSSYTKPELIQVIIGLQDANDKLAEAIKGYNGLIKENEELRKEIEKVPQTRLSEEEVEELIKENKRLERAVKSAADNEKWRRSYEYAVSRGNGKIFGPG